MRSCSGGGHAWLLSGGHAWLLGGGHAWDTMRYGDTVNERAVRILLECILVDMLYFHCHASYYLLDDVCSLALTCFVVHIIY